MFRYVVLGLLNTGTPLHGYALMKAYRDRVGTKLSTGNFYRDLQRLVQHGFVRMLERPTDSDPRRIVYQVTDEGRATFREWFTNPAELIMGNGHEDALSFRIAFIGEVAPADARTVLEGVQEELWTRAKSLERARSAALGATRAHGELPVLALMLGRRIRRVAAEVAFIEDLRRTYEEWLAGRPPMTGSAEQATRVTPLGSTAHVSRRSR